MPKDLLNARQSTDVINAIGDIYPNDKPELDYTNRFELICAVILSAQTTDVSVNKATPKLFEHFPTPQAMAAADVKDIEDDIKTLGLYRNKAKYLKKMAQQLIDEFDGQIPRTRKELMSLAGVGRKTANVVMSAGFGEPAIAVDTHVERVSKALKIVDGTATVRQTEDTLTNKLPRDIWNQAHHYLISYGRYQCPARKHDHNECLQLIIDHLSSDADGKTADKLKNFMEN